MSKESLRVNDGAFRRGKKYKVEKRKRILVGILIALELGGIALLASGSKKTKEANVPEGKVLYEVDYEARFGESYKDIAKKFYDGEEKEAYGSLSNYKNNIEDDNTNHLREGTHVKVPNIINSDNQYYQELMVVNKRLEELNSSLWITYTVNRGDDLYSIAQRCVSNVNQVDYCVGMIKSKNKLDNILFEGTTIVIPNPEYFKLLEQKGNLERLLLNSLDNSVQEEKSGKTY